MVDLEVISGIVLKLSLPKGRQQIVYTFFVSEASGTVQQAWHRGTGAETTAGADGLAGFL